MYSEAMTLRLYEESLKEAVRTYFGSCAPREIFIHPAIMTIIPIMPLFGNTQGWVQIV